MKTINMLRRRIATRRLVQAHENLLAALEVGQADCDGANTSNNTELHEELRDMAGRIERFIRGRQSDG